MDDKRHSGVWITAIVLLLLPVLYVGSYAGLVVPKGIWIGNTYWVDEAEVTNATAHYIFYRWGGNYAATIFWPLEQLDRRTRPESWPHAFHPKPDDPPSVRAANDNR